MFEISELKATTLADLQVIAKSIGLTKTSQLKKLDLVYQILDTQAANPTKSAVSEAKPKTDKPKRKRVVKTQATEPKAIPAQEKAPQQKPLEKKEEKKEIG